MDKMLTMPADGVETEIVPVRGLVVKSRWKFNLLTFLMVFGPGLIVMTRTPAGYKRLRNPCTNSDNAPFADP